MHHVVITEYRVLPGKMEDFFQNVRHWERETRGREDAPEAHTVLCGEDDPARVVIVTQFADRDKADSFAAAGFLDEFAEGILTCVDPGTGATHGYDIFYSTGGGRHVLFGEDSP
jgi:hypothetical protein